MTIEPTVNFDPYQPFDRVESSAHFTKGQVDKAGSVPLSGDSDVLYSDQYAVGKTLSQQQSLYPMPHTSTAMSSPSLLPDTLRGATQPIDTKAITPAVFRRSTLTKSRFIVLQKWEGVVLRVKETSFIARLVDLTEDGPDEEAEFPLEEVSPSDLSLLEEGAVFYWHIGYSDSASGQRTRASVIRFRRLPVWRPDELEAARKKAAQVSELLGWK